MTDETYNGWTNFPTWAVNLWLSNDEGLYDATRERVAEITAGYAFDQFTTERVPQRVADALQDFIESLGFQVDNGEGGTLYAEALTGIPADLYGWALAHVNWQEIADAWIED